MLKQKQLEINGETTASVSAWLDSSHLKKWRAVSGTFSGLDNHSDFSCTNWKNLGKEGCRIDGWVPSLVLIVVLFSSHCLLTLVPYWTVKLELRVECCSSTTDIPLVMEYSEGRLLLELGKGTWLMTHTHVMQQLAEFIWDYKILAFSYSEQHPHIHIKRMLSWLL